MVTKFLNKLISSKDDHLSPQNNVAVYDGLTRNDFKKGHLIEFLFQMGIIKRTYYKDDKDGRSYWIGSLDDD